MLSRCFSVLLIVIGFNIVGCANKSDSTSNRLPDPSTELKISGFSANPDHILFGQSATLNFSFSNGNGWIDNSIGNVLSGSSVNVKPIVTTTYTLTVTNDKAEKISSQVTITVEAPKITSFTATPQAINPGDSVTLSFVFEGSGSIDQGIGPVVSGTDISISPTKTTTYTLTVDNSGVLETRSVIVSVSPLPAIDITGFSANPIVIFQGDTTSLQFNFTGGSGTLDNGIGDVVSGSSVVVSPTESTIYTLAVKNSNNVQAIRRIKVIVQKRALQNPRQITAGENHSCALDDIGVICWGSNSYGQLDVPTLNSPTQISAGSYQTCAIDSTGVVCWGKDIGTMPTMISPTQISTGTSNNCAMDNGSVVCWGDNFYGQNDVPTLDTPTSVDAGIFSNCALDRTGVVCWGSSVLPGPLVAPEKLSHNLFSCVIDSGEVKCWGATNIRNSEFNILTPPTGLSNLTDIAVGYYHACAIHDSTVSCWGKNSSGQLDLPASQNPKQVAVGRNHTCQLDDSGVNCAGNNNYGQAFAPGQPYVKPAPVTTVDQIAGGDTHTCALHNSSVSCWGGNLYGQSHVPPLTNPKTISGNLDYSCAIDDTGLVCWGDIGAKKTYIPSYITNPIDVAVGYDFICVIQNGLVRCWPLNGTDSRGIVSGTPQLTNPSQVSAGFDFVCAASDDGVNCWGENTYGQTDAPQISNITKISAGFSSTCAIYQSNRLACWGDLYSGVNPPPTSLSNPIDIAVGSFTACAIDDNGVQCWGEPFDLPTFDNPQKIWMSGIKACIVDNSGLSCYRNPVNSISGDDLVVPY